MDLIVSCKLRECQSMIKDGTTSLIVGEHTNHLE
jgi:hypothetical protein